MALTMEQVHSQGLLVHHSLTSSNILLAPDNSLAILHPAAALTCKKYVENTFLGGKMYREHFYVCPNVVEGGKEYTQADDVFGIGALAYELATLVDKPTYNPG